MVNEYGCSVDIYIIYSHYKAKSKAVVTDFKSIIVTEFIITYDRLLIRLIINIGNIYTHKTVANIQRSILIYILYLITLSLPYYCCKCTKRLGTSHARAK
jgi:hypothetical protein